MPSPFPGMDPYLESHWRDVHHRLITYASDALQELLPPDLRSRVEERIVMAGPEGLGNPLFADLRVIASPGQGPGPVVGAMRMPGTDAILVDVEREQLTEGYIEIIDAGSGNRIVTIIEVLSPSNKTPGDDRRAYQHKQGEITKSETNLVEIDLLRGGRHVAAVPLANIRPDIRTPCMVCVRRATQPSRAEVYLCALARNLPTVQVPLRPADADAPLNLQDLIEQCYRKGRYEADLDYRREPDPPLTGPDAKWAAKLLREKGLRPARPRKNKRRQ